MTEDLDPIKVFFEEVFGVESEETRNDFSETNCEARLEHNTAEESAACNNCQSNFSSLNQLNIHISNTTSMCYLCGTQCCSEDNLKNHIDHECDIARRNRNIGMIALESAQFGRQRLDPRKYPHLPSEEDVDDRESTKYAEPLQSNKKIATLQPEKCKFLCAGCAQKFNDESELMKHKRLEHAVDRKFSCTIGGCGVVFKYYIELKRHRDKDHPELEEFQPVELDQSIWACPICSMNFRQENSCSVHIKVKHLGWSPDLHINCKECSKSFQSEQKMQEHHEIEHQGIRTVCPVCFTPVGNLRRHIQRVHETKISRFLCPDCPKHFGQKFDLNRHRKTVHLGIKNFECDLCGRRFGEGKDMTRHRSAVHLGMKIAYGGICIHCQKTFRNKNQKSQHICSAQSYHNEMKRIAETGNTKDLPDVILDPGDDAMLRGEPRLLIQDNQDGFGGVRFIVVQGVES